MVIDLDKSKYQSGESVRIRVKNVLSVPVWYAQNVNCGMQFFELETDKGKPVRYSQICDWVMAMHNFIKLNPGESFTGEWNGKILDNKTNQFVIAPSGRYRIVVPYSMAEKKAMGQGWNFDKQKEYSKILFYQTISLKEQFEKDNPQFQEVGIYYFNSGPAEAFDKKIIIRKANIAEALARDIWIMDTYPYKIQFGNFFFDFKKNKAGDIVDINTEVDHAWQSEAFESIVDLIEDGSYITIIDEKDIYWKMVFDKGKLKTYKELGK